MIENSITKNGPGNPPSEVVLPVGTRCHFRGWDYLCTDGTNGLICGTK